MVKTLIVTYTPRMERSRTRMLAHACIEAIEGFEEGDGIERLELCKDQPDIFTPEALQAYMKRDYEGEELDIAQSKLLAKMDRMTQSLMEADVVVLAYPMYNLSVPGVVKCWFDAVMLKGRTWDSDKGSYKGLMKGKKALVITTSGSVYSGQWSMLEHSSRLSKALFEFMGFSDVQVVVAEGIDKEPKKEKEILAKAADDIRSIVSHWYERKR